MRPDYTAPSTPLAAVRAGDDQQFGGISSRDVSLRDQIRDKLAVMVGRRNADKLLSVAEMTGADVPLMLDEARLAYNEGRPGEAAATAALAVLPISGAAKKGAKAAVKGAKAELKAAARSEPGLEAAIRVGGKVYRGPTHLDALAAIPDPALRREATWDASNRGFVNERGRFLDRYKAADYARNFGLFSDTAPSWALTAPELISENLRVRKKRGGLAVKRKRK